DPWRWPKLWAENPDIANPHWIFPGQIVRLRPGLPAPPVASAAATAPAPSPARAVAARPAPPRPRGPNPALALRQVGFVDEGAFHSAGVIGGSVEEKIMLATGDQAYIEFPAAEKRAAGATYAVYRVDTASPVREPGSRALLGYLVHICGEVALDPPPRDGDRA